ncbi:hypothetical protein ACO34A_22665 (plasmid) [Rhizobium sp. ACO-34A]|nr:branched-chain amino acid ABC transporter permease [Rhizobium sp. ACO-34A]ATN36594.1 hypothetical protein ACO34A_22665 [Rhizobium sp. ACO-34A]
MTIGTDISTTNRPAAGIAVPGIGPWLAAAALLLGLPLVFQGDSAVSTLNYLGIMALFALSYNVLLGQTGLLSLGHATFFGLGGFVVCHIILGLSEAGLSFPLPLVPLFGGLATLLLGVFAGWLASARGGMPFAMITLGLSELVYAAAALFPSIYGSEEGIGIDRMELGSFLGFDFASPVHVYYVIAAWLLVCAFLMYYLARTPLGLLSNAVRDNAERIEFLGFSARRVRMLSYAIASGFAGVAGGLAALNFEIMTVHELSAGQSALVLIMTYIGGTRVFFGPILGAVVIGLMKIWLSDVTPAWQLYFGLLFIFVVMVAPGGLAGMVLGGASLIRSRRLKVEAPLLAAVACTGAATVAGVIFLIELGYRIGLDAALGPDLVVLGVPLDAQSVWSWLLALALAVGGSLATRAVVGSLNGLRQTLAITEKGAV